MAMFIQSWEENDVGMEIGPFIGTMPHVSVIQDAQYNIEDLMSFVMMGNWYFTTNTLLFTEYPNDGLNIVTEIEDENLLVSLPDNAMVYEFQIQYDPQHIALDILEDVAELQFVYRDETGLLTIMAEKDEYDQLPIKLSFKSRKPQSTVNMSMRSINHDLIQDFQASQSLLIENIPATYALFNNYPNPFNPITVIDYAIPEPTHVRLVVYDILGRQITKLVDRVDNPGYQSIKWNGTNDYGQLVSAGMYFYHLQAGKFSKVRKMVLLK